MPFHYDISEELNLVVYVGAGTVNAKDFFNTGDEVAGDSRLRPRMRIIIDVTLCAFEVYPGDFKLVTQKFNESKQRGQEVGHTAVVSHSTGLKLLNDAIKLIMHETSLDTGIFHTEADAIRWHGLPEEAALPFWMQVREQARAQAR